LITQEEAFERVSALEWTYEPLEWQRLALEAFDRHPDCRTLTIPCTRQAGKSENAKRQVVELAPYTGPEDTDLYITPTYLDSRRPWRLTERLVRLNSQLGTPARAEKTINWAWGACTQFRHGAGGEMTADTVGTIAIVDEAGKISNELHEFLDPMLKRHDSRKINYGTPRGMNRFYEDYVLGLDEDGNSPLRSGKPPINKLYLSLKVTHEEIPWHTEDKIAESKRRMSPALFAQEYEAAFLAGANEAFPGVGRLHRCEVEEPSPDASYSIGYDPARKQDRAAVSVLRTDVDQPYEVYHWRSPLGLDWGRQFEIIENIADRYPAVITLDATGLGDVVLSRLRARGLAVDPVICTEKENLEMSEDMVVLVNTDGMLFLSEDACPDSKAAFEEMRDYQVDAKDTTSAIISGLNLKYGHSPGKHDDSVSARLLAARALRRMISYVPVA
jgi:hypothetical protein